MSFLKKSIANAIEGYLERNNYIQGHTNRNDRFGALVKAWGYIVSDMMVGDYYEFGTYTGNSMVSSIKAHFIFKSWLDDQRVSSEPWRREVFSSYVFNPVFCGYDTFAGMPANDEEHGVWAQGSFRGDLESVRQRCVETGLPEDRLNLVKGDFKEVEAASTPGKAAIINIDCDLYQSAVEALRIVKDKIQQGTVLLADEYHAFGASNSKGERRAMREFSEQTGITFEPWFAYKFSGHAFLCHLSE